MHFSLTFVVELIKQEYVEVPVLLCTEYIFQYLYSNIYVLFPFAWTENYTCSQNMEATCSSEMLTPLFQSTRRHIPANSYTFPQCYNYDN